MFIQEMVSSIVQIILFSCIPLVWWIIGYRKKDNFFHWIGLKKIENKVKVIKPFILTTIGFIIFGFLSLYMIRGVETATSSYAGLGLAGLPTVIIYALFHTSLSEELLFRGFLLKRISNKFGLVVGNLIQSIIFGLLHGAMFISYVGIVKAVVIILFTGLLAYAMGYINEKLANGSILPSWCIHFISNLFSGCISLFSIL